jgi:hypothetical protein
MFGSSVLDVMVGLFFVYLMLSILCSAINELLARVMDMRANTLEEGIKKLLADNNINLNLAQDIYNHPLIQALAQGKEKPSYIPAKTFALALIDVVDDAANVNTKAQPVAPSPTEKTIEDVRATINDLPDGEIKKSLSMLLGHAGKNVEEARKNIEDWFNNSMERVSGMYKRKTQLIIMFLAFLVSFGWNADSFFIAQSLSQDSTLRSSLVAAAQESVKQPAPTANAANADPKQIIEQIEAQAKDLQLPIGWSKERLPKDVLGFCAKLFGLIFTMLALSLGAPFWFDILNKIVNLRASGKPPEEKAKS